MVVGIWFNLYSSRAEGAVAQVGLNMSHSTKDRRAMIRSPEHWLTERITLQSTPIKIVTWASLLQWSMGVSKWWSEMISSSSIFDKEVQPNPPQLWEMYHKFVISSLFLCLDVSKKLINVDKYFILAFGDRRYTVSNVPQSSPQVQKLSPDTPQCDRGWGGNLC